MKEPKPGAQGLRRFYKIVTVEPRAGGFAVLLDGKPIKTPAMRAMIAPTPALAERIAEEWRGQGERLSPLAMPLTQMLNTAIDRMADGKIREDAIGEIAAYAATDLVCFRATEPPALVARQAEAWQPLLEWLAETYGARLETTAALVPPRHSAEAETRIRDAVAACDGPRLAGLHVATGALGSVVIALALAEGRLDAEAAYRAAHLDDLYQIEVWGEDAEAMERLERIRADVAAAAAFLSLARG